jgi:hypothetical protein
MCAPDSLNAPAGTAPNAINPIVAHTLPLAVGAFAANVVELSAIQIPLPVQTNSWSVIGRIGRCQLGTSKQMHPQVNTSERSTDASHNDETGNVLPLESA